MQKISQAIESVIPIINIIAARQEPRSSLGTGFVGDSTFPFLELPMEILEIILQCADYRSTQSLLCLASGLKKAVNAKSLFKFHFPRKYLDPAQSTSGGSIYWREISTLARWRGGKYTNKFRIDGELQVMDDNIMIFTASTGEFKKHFWMRCDDITRTKHNIASQGLQYWDRICIIDSKHADPIAAIIERDKVEVCVGSNVVARLALPPPLIDTSTPVLACNNKLYMGQYLFSFDKERISSTRLITGNDGTIIDANPLNDMYMSRKSIGYPVTLWSAENEKIGVIENIFLNTTNPKIKFLDEYRVVGVHGNTIDVADIRKLNGTAVASFTTLRDSSEDIIDAVNHRVIRLTEVSFTSQRMANIWDLNTGQWTGGLYIDSFRKVALNTRYLCVQNFGYTDIVDFR
jgi:hypothetical protein